MKYKLSTTATFKREYNKTICPHLLGGGLYRKKGGSLNLPPLGRLVEMLTYVVFSSDEEKT